MLYLDVSSLAFFIIFGKSVNEASSSPVPKCDNPKRLQTLSIIPCGVFVGYPPSLGLPVILLPFLLSEAIERVMTGIKKKKKGDQNRTE